MIPKGGWEYHGIVLVEVIWKAVTVIPNCCLTAAITCHNFLHGFRAVRGAGTANLKLNLIQQVSALREEVLHEIFLNLQKS